MGIDSADYDRDGWPDIVKTNFSDDTKNLYHNDHNGEFTDMASFAGIAASQFAAPEAAGELPDGRLAT